MSNENKPKFHDHEFKEWTMEEHDENAGKGIAVAVALFIPSTIGIIIYLLA